MGTISKMTGSEDATVMTLMGEFTEVRDEVVRLRRLIHQNPELSYHEEQTAKIVASTLRGLGIEVREHAGGEGVVGLLTGALPGKVVALRADMDALPLKEENDVAFRSKNEGVMHACGHDSHVAMLLGAAMLLAKHRDELHGTCEVPLPASRGTGW